MSDGSVHPAIPERTFRRNAGIGARAAHDSASARRAGSGGGRFAAVVEAYRLRSVRYSHLAAHRAVQSTMFNRRSRKYESIGLAHVGTLLAEAIGDEERIRHALGVWPAWEQAVGTQIARNARPVSLRGGVLMVHVQHSVWMQELSAMREVLLRRIHRVAGGSLVRELRFKVAPLPTTAPDGTRSGPEPTTSRGSIPYDLAQEIRSIGSPMLRAAIMNAASRWAGWRRPEPK